MRKMKDSGIEWIGEIPEDWEVKRTRFIAQSLNKGNGITKEDVKDDGDIQCVRYGEIYSKYDRDFSVTFSRTDVDMIASPKYIQKGDILFTCTGELVEEIGKNIVYMGESPCLAGGDIIVMQHEQNPIFLNYALNSSYSQAQKSSGKTKLKVVHISAGEIGNVAIVLPPLAEQTAIAAYLDTQCAHIDSVIEKTKQSIEEYKKLKQAVITQAVTKGVRGEREMKDSGVEWIGEIPREWNLIPFRHILKERQEKNSPVKTEERLSLSIDLGVTLYAEKTTNLDRFKEDFEQYKLAHVGDLVMNSMNMIVGATGVSNYYGCVSPVYYTFYDELSDHATAKYCEYIFRSKTMLRVLYSLGKGIYAIVRGDDRVNTCRLKVSKEDLKSIIIPQPDVDEQREIIAYLDQKCAEIDTLITKKEQFLTELESYKKSMIYEYVTGKKEVES